MLLLAMHEDLENLTILSQIILTIAGKSGYNWEFNFKAIQLLANQN